MATLGSCPALDEALIVDGLGLPGRVGRTDGKRHGHRPKPPVSLNRLAADGAHMNILLKNTYLHRTLAVTNPLYSELSCSDGGSPGIEVLLTRAVGMWSYLFPGEIDSRTSL